MELDPIEGLAYALIELALDEQGKNLFTLENKMTLMKKANPDTLSVPPAPIESKAVSPKATLAVPVG